MRHTLWILVLLGCGSDPVALDANTLCSDLAAYEGVEVDLDVTLDPNALLRWSSSAALCGTDMPCCNMAAYHYLVPGCGAVAVALVPPEGDVIPELACESRGGNSTTECAECDTPGSRRVVGVRGVLGTETVGVLDGGRYRPLAVTRVRLAAE
jgi:hypothetical protein